MEGTEEKKDRQTDDQIETDSARHKGWSLISDQWSDERETQEKERTEGKAEKEQTELIEVWSYHGRPESHIEMKRAKMREVNNILVRLYKRYPGPSR